MNKIQQYALNWAVVELERHLEEVARELKKNPNKLEFLDSLLKVRVNFFKDKFNQIINEK